MYAHQNNTRYTYIVLTLIGLMFFGAACGEDDPPLENCVNAKDDDGKVDCDDPNCQIYPTCKAKGEQ